MVELLLDLTLQFLCYPVGALCLGLVFPSIQLPGYNKREPGKCRRKLFKITAFTYTDKGKKYWRQGAVEFAGMVVVIGLVVLVYSLWP